MISFVVTDCRMSGETPVLHIDVTITVAQWGDRVDDVMSSFPLNPFQFADRLSVAVRREFLSLSGGILGHRSGCICPCHMTCLCQCEPASKADRRIAI